MGTTGRERTGILGLRRLLLAAGRRARWRWTAREAAGAAAGLAGVVALLAVLPLRLNLASPSAPRGLYRLAECEPERGSWVVVCLPPEVAAFGSERGYLGGGVWPARCPDGSAEVLKRVGAVAGDEVTVAGGDEEARVTIAGQIVAGAPVLEADSQGRPLPAPPAAGWRVGSGELFLLSTTIPNSWDSRYYGPVPGRAVKACAAPLWAEAP